MTLTLTLHLHLEASVEFYDSYGNPRSGDKLGITATCMGQEVHLNDQTCTYIYMYLPLHVPTFTCTYIYMYLPLQVHLNEQIVGATFQEQKEKKKNCYSGRIGPIEKSGQLFVLIKDSETGSW